MPGDALEPTVKAPANLPVEVSIEHVGEVKRPTGVTLKVHVLPTKFEPEALTIVPMRPDVGVRAKVNEPVRVNGAVSVSPAFVLIVTVYPPRGAAEATRKPPLNVPLEIEHEYETNRPDGEAESVVHAVPA
jgi:hypothetical protein